MTLSRRIRITILLLILINVGFAQPKSINNVTGFTFMNGAHVNQDNSISLVGFNKNEQGFKLVDINQDGDVIKSTVFTNIEEPDQYGFYIRGLTGINNDKYIFTDNKQGTIIIKFDSDHNIIYSKLIQNTVSNVLYPQTQAISPQLNGEVYISERDTDNTFGLYKLDILGNELKKNRYFNSDKLLLIPFKLLSKDNKQYLFTRVLENSTLESIACFEINESGDILNSVRYKNIELIDVALDEVNNEFVITSRDLTKNRPIVILTDDNFDIRWSKLINIESRHFPWNPRNISIAENGIILNIATYSNNPEILVKLSNSGDLMYSKMILDQQTLSPSLLYSNGEKSLLSYFNGSIIIFDNDNFELNCSYLEACPELIDCQIEKESITINKASLFFNFPKISFDTKSIETNSFESCTPIQSPDPFFHIKDRNLCIGDTILIDQDSIFPLGSSLWIINNNDSLFGKNNIYYPTIDNDKFIIEHILSVAGCHYSQKDTINIGLGNEDILGLDSTLCGEEYIFDISPKDYKNVIWDDGIIDHQRKIEKGGVYSALIINEFDCEFRDTIEIEFKEKPKLNLIDEISFCDEINYTFDINLNEDETFYWNGGSTNLDFFFTSSEWLIGNKENVCGISVDSTYIKFIDCQRPIILPNVFSPNGDFNNDNYTFELEDYKILSFDIYDRWGSNLKSSLEPSVNWDGYYKNELLDPGVYTILINLEHFLSSEKRTITGSVTLIR